MALFLILLSAILPGQVVGQSTGKCSFEGQVVQASTGAPIRGVRISLIRVEGGTTAWVWVLTDAAGMFAIQNVSPGRYRLVGERTGFVRTEYDQKSAHGRGAAISCAAGQEITDLTLPLLPAGVISGRVTTGGEPVTGAVVQLMKKGYPSGRMHLSTVIAASTNDLGEYRIRDVAPGRYYLVAFAPTRVGAPAGALAPVFYPNAEDVLRASPVEFQPGTDLHGVDVALYIAS